MTHDGWEVIEGDDVVGTASARLLSTCADRGERLAALSLLGLLLDHADDAGRIRLPLDALAHELDVEHDRAVRLLQHLVAVEAVYAEGDAVVVAGAQPEDSAMAPSRFLANLMAVLEREPAAPAPSPTTAGRATGPVKQPEPRPRRRVLVALGVGLAAMALATAPSGDPATSLRTVSAPAAPTGRAPWATLVPTPTATTLATGEPPVDDPGPVASDDPARAGIPESLEGRPEGGQPPGDAAGEQGGPRPAPRRSEPPPSAPPPLLDVPAAAPSPPGPPPTTVPASRAATPSDPGDACPADAPVAAVSETRLLGAGPSNVLDLAGERDLSVRGTVRNPSTAAMTIASVEVGAGQGDSREVVSVNTVPMVIPPGGTATWEATLQADAGAPSESIIDVRVTDWSWVDPALAARCPS